MTLDKFKSNARKYLRCQIIAFGILFLGMFLAIIPESILEERAGRAGFDGTCIVVTAVSFPIIAAIIFFGVSYYPKKRLRQLGLVCPNCNKQFGKHRTRLAVMRTGCCRFCGAKVIDSNDLAK